MALIGAVEGRPMKRRAFAMFGIWVCSMLLTTPVLAQPKTPTQMYLDYVSVVSKAKTLAEVLPYLSKAYRTNLESVPKENQPVWLKRLKDSVEYTNLKVTKETIAGAKCTLDATGTSGRGNAMKGRIMLVKEGADWKLDEAAWTT
jgi:hypothetical protein